LIGKVHTEITFANRSQDGIGNGMQKRIGIRVALNSAGGRNAHTSQDKRSAVNQWVCVVADADSEHKKVSGQLSVVNGQWSVVSGQL
jgi:hypothetical protein